MSRKSSSGSGSKRSTFNAKIPTAPRSMLPKKPAASEWVKKKTKRLNNTGGFRSYVDVDVTCWSSKQLSYNDEDDVKSASPIERFKATVVTRPSANRRPRRQPLSPTKPTMKTTAEPLKIKGISNYRLLAPEERRSATASHEAPPDCTHDAYLSKKPIRIIIRRDGFRARKAAKSEVTRMIMYRGFDRGHNFDPGSLQNIFNLAMLLAQTRSGLEPTPWHTAFQKAMEEVVYEPETFTARDNYISLWTGMDADFYIMNNEERGIWAERVIAARMLQVGSRSDAAPTGPRKQAAPGQVKDFQEFKAMVDESTTQEIEELQRWRSATVAGEICSPWFQQAMVIVLDNEIAAYS